MSGYVRGVVAFVAGMVLSYLVAALLNSGEAGIFTAVCFFGALIYAEFCEHNQRCEKEASSTANRINKRYHLDETEQVRKKNEGTKCVK